MLPGWTTRIAGIWAKSWFRIFIAFCLNRTFANASLVAFTDPDTSGRKWGERSVAADADASLLSGVLLLHPLRSRRHLGRHLLPSNRRYAINNLLTPPTLSEIGLIILAKISS